MSYVIVEGVDKSGKSTLARYISEKTGLPLVKHLPEKQSVFIECIDFLTDSNPCIIDRLHLSEMVYGPVKRNKCRLDLRQNRIFELLCKTAGTFNILCSDTEAKLRKRFIEDKEDYLTLEDIKPILEGFEVEKKKSILDWHSYTIGDSMDDVVDKVKTHFKLLGVEKRKKYLKYRTLGNIFKAKTIIIGEKYGPGLLPPLVPFGNNYPGRILYEGLELAEIDWNDILVTNAIKYENDKSFDNLQAFKDEISESPINKIICLGNNAQERVNEFLEAIVPTFGFIQLKVPHPSFWARKGKSIASYAEILKEAIEL